MPSHPLRIWLHGSTGRMGQALKSAIANSPDLDLVGASAGKFDAPSKLAGTPTTSKLLADALNEAQAEIVIDFSGIEGNRTLLEAAKSLEVTTLNVGFVIGTTGLSPSTLDSWNSVTHKVLIAPNTSLGILKLAKAAQGAAPALYQAGFDIEITETHHNRKKDAPSGTALLLAKAIQTVLPELQIVTNRTGLRSRNELGIHAVRGGGVVGEHEIRFISDTDEVKLSHRAFSRSLFADGALHLGRWLHSKPSGKYELLQVNL